MGDLRHPLTRCRNAAYEREPSAGSEVYGSGVYASRGSNPTTNLRDGIFADSLNWRLNHKGTKTLRQIYSRSLKANSALPAQVNTYCLPPTEYVIGPDRTDPPTIVFHSKF